MAPFPPSSEDVWKSADSCVLRTTCPMCSVGPVSADVPCSSALQGSRRSAAALQRSGRPLTEAHTPQLHTTKRRRLHSMGTRSQARPIPSRGLLAASSRSVISGVMHPQWRALRSRCVQTNLLRPSCCTLPVSSQPVDASSAERTEGTP